LVDVRSDYFDSPAGGSVAGGVVSAGFSVSFVAGGGVAGFSSDLAQPLMTIAVTTSIKAINFFIF